MKVGQALSVPPERVNRWLHDVFVRDLVGDGAGVGSGHLSDLRGGRHLIVDAIVLLGEADGLLDEEGNVVVLVFGLAE